jgi:hypothetical protein
MLCVTSLEELAARILAFEAEYRRIPRPIRPLELDRWTHQLAA